MISWTPFWFDKLSLQPPYKRATFLTPSRFFDTYPLPRRRLQISHLTSRSAFRFCRSVQLLGVCDKNMTNHQYHFHPPLMIIYSYTLTDQWIIFPDQVITISKQHFKAPRECNVLQLSLHYSRGGKRGGAWEHCSQKEMDGTIFVRRIWAKFTALVANFIKMAIYRTFAVGPIKN